MSEDKNFEDRVDCLQMNKEVQTIYLYINQLCNELQTVVESAYILCNANSAGFPFLIHVFFSWKKPQ